jgi:hypothetical protein
MCLFRVAQYTEALEECERLGIEPDLTIREAIANLNFVKFVQLSAEFQKVLQRGPQFYSLIDPQSTLGYQESYRGVRTLCCTCAEMEQSEMPWSGGKARDHTKADHALAMRRPCSWPDSPM